MWIVATPGGPCHCRRPWSWPASAFSGPWGTPVCGHVVECRFRPDGGAVRTYGHDNLTDSNTRDIDIIGNIIRDTHGNTDGCIDTYKPLFGMGLYIDHYSDNVLIEGNTIIGSTHTGVLYQLPTPQVPSGIFHSSRKIWSVSRDMRMSCL